MEPISAALTFATMVGLMADFASSRAREESIDIAEFIEWLRFHGHNELLQLIQDNLTTTISVKAALAEGTDKILAQLADLERMLVALTAENSTLRDLAVNLSPMKSFSMQSKEILISFEKALAGKALVHNSLSGSSLIFVDGKGNNGYSPSDPRFLEADLSDLVRGGFLERSTNASGKRLYQITRSGSSVGQVLMKSPVA